MIPVFEIVQYKKELYILYLESHSIEGSPWKVHLLSTPKAKRDHRGNHSVTFSCASWSCSCFFLASVSREGVVSELCQFNDHGSNHWEKGFSYTNLTVLENFRPFGPKDCDLAEMTELLGEQKLSSYDLQFKPVSGLILRTKEVFSDELR